MMIYMTAKLVDRYILDVTLNVLVVGVPVAAVDTAAEEHNLNIQHSYSIVQEF